ncbi:hypothetical protein REPUB_Repub02eG0178400 [Reevesia pubescens]
MGCLWNYAKKLRRYHDVEHTKNVRYWNEVFDMLIQDPTLLPASPKPDDEELRTYASRWPEYPYDFRETCQEYIQETGMLRFNYYFLYPFPELALGVGRHRDGGALTVLAQDDVGGLQIKRQSDEEWIPVKPIPNAYIINIAYTLQVP